MKSNRYYQEIWISMDFLECQRQSERIEVTFKIKSDAPRERIKELLEFAKNRSPVFDIISHPTAVKVSLQD